MSKKSIILSVIGVLLLVSNVLIFRNQPFFAHNVGFTTDVVTNDDFRMVSVSVIDPLLSIVLILLDISSIGFLGRLSYLHLTSKDV